MPIAQAASGDGHRERLAELAATSAPATMEKRLPSSTEGSESSSRRQRRDTVKTAKPSDDSSAATLPASAPPSSPSRTMTRMPTSAMAMAPQVSGRTLSPRTAQPRSAVRKGEAANRNTALAMVVAWIA